MIAFKIASSSFPSCLRNSRRSSAAQASRKQSRQLRRQLRGKPGMIKYSTKIATIFPHLKEATLKTWLSKYLGELPCKHHVSRTISTKFKRILHCTCTRSTSYNSKLQARSLKFISPVLNNFQRWFSIWSDGGKLIPPSVFQNSS